MIVFGKTDRLASKKKILTFYVERRYRSSNLKFIRRVIVELEL